MNPTLWNSKNPSPLPSQRKKSVCGFLNHHGGVISFGRTNTGAIVGVDPTDHSLRKLSQQITSRIKPEIAPDIRVIEEQGKHLIVVTVPEGISKPYYLDGIAYMRTGTENRVMPPDEIKRIILSEHGIPWDDQPCRGATLEDIEAPSVRTFLERAQKERRFDADPSTPVKIALEKLGVISGGLPTHAAILFFGKDPQRFFIQSEVRCARFKGEEVSSTYLNMNVLHGRIDQLIEDTNRFIAQTIRKAAWVVPGKMQREEHWEYPPDALREAVINAVCHRDYNASGNVQIRIFDSRAQVWNPGKLPEGVTVDLLKIEHSSRPRNKTIARLLFYIGYIEQWGSGTLSMITACERDGVPDPQFRETGDDFVVTFSHSTVNTLLEHPAQIENF
ncbi:MAG: helix-turn-helix domain-containing protein [Methanoregula sp.]